MTITPTVTEPLRSACMTDYIGEYIDHLRALDRAQATIDVYEETLRRIDRELRNGLARAHAYELHTWLRAGDWSRATRRLYQTIITGFFGWQCDPRNEGGLDFDPTTLLPDPPKRPRRRPRPINTAQLGDILARSAEPYRTWFVLAAYAGLRCCEIAGLDREHVTAEHLFVVAGKGGHERILRTHPDVWAAIELLPPGPVARSSTGGQATRQQIIGRGNRYLHKVLGLRDVTMHRLRHWSGTEFYRRSKDILATQQWLGHASPDTTAGYAEIASDAMAAAVAALPRVGAW